MLIFDEEDDEGLGFGELPDFMHSHVRREKSFLVSVLLQCHSVILIVVLEFSVSEAILDRSNCVFNEQNNVAVACDAKEILFRIAKINELAV